MFKKNSFCIIGAGKLGSQIIKTILQYTQNLLVIDKNKSRVQEISEFVSDSLILDTSDFEALKESGIIKYTNVIVSIGDNVIASLLTVFNLLELKIPNIYVKSINKQHEKFLQRLGIENIINPDKESGRRVALNVIWQTKNQIELGVNKDYSIFTLTVKNENIIGYTLENLGKKYSKIWKKFNIILIEKITKNKIIIPHKDTILNENNKLWIMSNNNNILEISNLFQNRK